MAEETLSVLGRMWVFYLLFFCSTNCYLQYGLQSWDICGKKSANGTKFNIGGDFRQCQSTPIFAEICAACFHWGSMFNGHGSLGQKIQIDQLEGHGQVNSNHDGLGGTTEKQVYISYCCNSSTATGNHSGYCINKLLAVKRIIIVRSPAWGRNNTISFQLDR